MEMSVAQRLVETVDVRPVERRLSSFAPTTQQLIGEVPVCSGEAVVEAFQKARSAQLAWGTLSLTQRCRDVLRFRDAIVDAAEELVELLALETGKPQFEALTHEVLLAADIASFYARRAPRVLAPQRLAPRMLWHRRSILLYKPRGVVAILSPWNYPLVIPLGEIFAALVAGNAVVLKPSEETPLIALKIREVFGRSGLDVELLQVVTGDAATGTAVIDARPDALVFTGSVAVGRKVAAACGEKLIPCTVELGGKAAAIVCADAEIESTARSLVLGAFANSGQVCVSVERAFVHAAIYDRLLERIVHHAGQLRSADARGLNGEIGSMINRRQTEHVLRLVEDATLQGARLCQGGVRDQVVPQRLSPAVLSDCTADMAVMREEIFGPVLPIMKVDSDDQAIELSNQSPLGLAAYVFSGDRRRGRHLAKRLRAGVVMVNDVLSAYGTPEAPFGGVKSSGIGKVHGDEGLRFMTECCHISYDVWRMGNPLWFPYTDGKLRSVKRLMRMLFGKRALLGKLLGIG